MEIWNKIILQYRLPALEKALKYPDKRLFSILNLWSYFATYFFICLTSNVLIESVLYPDGEVFFVNARLLMLIKLNVFIFYGITHFVCLTYSKKNRLFDYALNRTILCAFSIITISEIPLIFFAPIHKHVALQIFGHALAFALPVAAFAWFTKNESKAIKNRLTKIASPSFPNLQTYSHYENRVKFIFISAVMYFILPEFLCQNINPNNYWIISFEVYLGIFVSIGSSLHLFFSNLQSNEFLQK